MAQEHPDPGTNNITSKMLKYKADNYPNAVALREEDFGICRGLTWAGFDCWVRYITLALRARFTPPASGPAS